MTSEAWKHPQRQYTRREGPPHTHRKLRTAGGPQNRVCRMWPMLWDESYRWADSTRDSAVCPHVALTWKACPSERRCMSLNVQGYGVLFVCVLVTQSCLTLCDPMDCGPPGSSVHGILQARIQEWVAFPSLEDLPYPGIEPGSPALQADSSLYEPPAILGFSLGYPYYNKLGL